MWNTLGTSIVLLIGLTATCVVGRSRNNIVEAECSQLPANIIEEVRSYQPIADRIVKEIVEGKYAGVTFQK